MMVIIVVEEYNSFLIITFDAYIENSTVGASLWVPGLEFGFIFAKDIYKGDVKSHTVKWVVYMHQVYLPD